MKMTRDFKQYVLIEAESMDINRACAGLSGSRISYRVRTETPNIIEWWYKDYDNNVIAGTIRY